MSGAVPPVPAAAAAATPGSAAAAAVGPTRKTLFRKSGGGARLRGRHSRWTAHTSVTADTKCSLASQLLLLLPRVSLVAVPQMNFSRLPRHSMRRRRSTRPTRVRARRLLISCSRWALACSLCSIAVLAMAALVEEMLSALREEVKEMDRTNWLYETQDPNVAMRIKI